MTKELQDDTQIWKDKVLVEPIDEVVLNQIILESTRMTAEQANKPPYDFDLPECGGIMYGSLVEKKFYIFFKNCLVNNFNSFVTLPLLIPQDVKLIKELSDKLNGFRTIIYHSHPKITQETLKKFYPEISKEIISLIQDEIDNGIHNHLSRNGTKPSLDRVFNETLSRTLSEDDMKNTVGKYHLLISPTLYENDNVSHLNLYKLKNKRGKLIERVKIRVMNEKEKPFFEQLNRKFLESINELYEGMQKN